MIVFAFIITAVAAVVTGFVLLGNYQRTPSEEFLGGGVMVASWIIMGLFWLAWGIG